jgi:nickel/cobalt exporter
MTLILTTFTQALVWGAVHALVPCPHSWPMLLPFARSARGPLGSALLFGLGLTLTATAVGALAGGAVLAVPPEARDSIELGVGSLMVILGLIFLLRPQLMHAGHVHPHDGHEGPAHACDAGAVRRLQRVGPRIGLVLLGAGNMAIPCWTNVPAIGLAISSGGALGGALVGALFALSATAAMIVVLLLAVRGIRILEGLASRRVEGLVLRLSGLLLVSFGLSLIFHWHEHG